MITVTNGLIDEFRPSSENEGEGFAYQILRDGGIIHTEKESTI
jgi:hypothetical protein